MSDRHVACVVEGDYLPHLAAMLHSLLEHAPSVRVHVLHGPETDATPLAGWLGERVRLHEIADERVAGLPTEGFTGKATWYRILLPAVLPDVDRVLFLDGDLVVCDALDELFATDLSGAYVGAVTNVFPPELAGRPGELGLAPHDYFNAGVLLMDLDAMRRDGVADRLYRYGVEHAGELVMRDQDALNAVLAGRRAALSPRWNVMNIMRFDWADAVFGADAVAAARRDPAIRHFEGPDDNKPWHRACERDDRERYFEHRRQTPWPRVRPVGPRLSASMRRALVVAGVLLAWSLIPLALLLRQVWVHGGVLSGSDGMLAGSDQMLYLTWIRESGTDVLISNEYRLGESHGVFLHPMFLLSGALWQLGLGLKLSLLVWKPVAAAALGVGVWLFTGRFLAGRERLAATALALFFFSPVLPLLIWGDAGLGALDHLVFLFTSGESNPALQLWGYLHAALVLGLMALFVLGADRLLTTGRGLWWTAGAGALVSWMHPWQGATLLAVLCGIAAWGRLDRRYRVLLVPAIALAAPLVYEFLLLQLDADWSVDADQNAGGHAPWWILLAALGPLLVPAVAAVRGGARDDARRMLLLWPVAALAVYFATDQFPYHALQGVTLPLAVLAVEGWRRLRVPGWAGVACVAALTVPGMAFMVDQFQDSRRAGVAPYVLHPDENAALAALEDLPAGGVLARPYLGSTVPALTGHDTWVGQFTWTPDYEARRARAEDLFAGRLDPVAARRLVTGTGAAYLLTDCGQRADPAALLGDLVARVQRFGCAAVYSLNGAPRRARVGGASGRADARATPASARSAAGSRTGAGRTAPAPRSGS